MQAIQETRPVIRKTRGFGWRGNLFAIVVVGLSLLLSIAAVDVIASALL